MVFFGAVLTIFFIVAIVIVKFNLEWLRVISLFLLPSLIFAFYAATIEIRDYSHLLEGFGFMFMVSLLIMSPALLIFSTAMVWIEKRFEFNLLILLFISIFVGGISASPYLLDSSLGETPFTTALYTAPVAVLLESFFDSWRKNKKVAW